MLGVLISMFTACCYVSASWQNPRSKVADGLKQCVTSPVVVDKLQLSILFKAKMHHIYSKRQETAKRNGKSVRQPAD